MPLSAWAGGDSGLYLGGGVGQSAIEVDTADPGGGQKFVFDGTDNAFKVIIGYNIGIIPLLDLGVEASYVDFGKIEETSAGRQANAEATGFDGFGVAALTFGPFGVFAKAGAINWDSDTTLGGTGVSDSGTDPAYGIGVRFQLLSISIRAEYEVFDVEGLQDLTLMSASALYTF